MSSSRTFRVFISSTFSDLTAERDALQSSVFPRLRELCERRGARFAPIDLRWGVSSKAAQDLQTMEICMDEIRRCQQTKRQPNFVIMLGRRYGWRPLPAALPAEQFTALCQTEALAPYLQDIDAWYSQVDENAVPPLRLLQSPRPSSDKASLEDEVSLLRVLERAAIELGWKAEQRVKLGGSATEQEIVQGLLSESALSDARAHASVLARVRR